MKIHLDTDLGGDIDDLCALALVLAIPEAELVGVTTVTEEAGRRAGYVKYALALAGRQDVPVAAGADVSLGCFRYRPGYPPEQRYWPEAVPPAPGPLRNALDLLKQSADAGAILVGLGQYTNFALLEQRAPGALAAARLVLMGGLIRPAPAGFPPWTLADDYNVQLDVDSARAVLQSSDPTLVPLEVTGQTALRRADLPSLRRAGPLARLIALQAEAFASDDRIRERYSPTCPGLPNDFINFQHDPLACAVAFGWPGAIVESLPLAIEKSTDDLRLRETTHGRPTRVVTSVDGAEFNQFWLRTVTWVS